MNLLKKSLLYLAVIMCGFTVASCGDDDEQDPTPVLKPLDSEMSFAGVTITYPESNPSSQFRSESSTYTFTLDANTMKADLLIGKAKFLNGMPEFDMDFKGIAFDSAINNPTTIVFNCDALTPEIGGRPFPQFPITDLKATLSTAISQAQMSWIPLSLEISFICDYRGTPYRVNFKGTPIKK